MISKIWTIIERIIIFFLNIVFKVCGKELSEELVQNLLQFVKFGIVGLSNTVISYVIYAGSLIAFRKMGVLQNVNYLVAQSIAFVLSVLWSFYWNNRFVFAITEGEHRSIWKALLKTYISYSFTGLFLNSVLLILWIQIIGISEFLAPMFNLLISVPLNYLINKLWAFKVDK